MLIAGAARALIDPPLPHDPQGYVRRETPAQRHGDPLQITAVALTGRAGAAIILAADLAGLDHGAAERIRTEVAQQTGCEASQVLLNCSHSHAAPWVRTGGGKLGGGDDTTTPVEQAYFDRLPYDFASAARSAWRSRRQVRVSGGVGRVPGLAVNRRERWQERTILGWNPDGFVDEEVPVIRIDDLDGDPVATIVAFGCHPVVVGPEVDATGTDYVGPLRRRVDMLRGGGVCVFLQGAAGNVLPLEGFFDHDGPQQPMGERLGLEAAHAVADADPLARTIERIPFGSVSMIALYRRSISVQQPDQAVAAVRAIVDLPLLAAPSRGELAAERDRWAAELATANAENAPRARTNPMRYHLNWAEAMLARGSLDGWTHSAGEVWAMRVGDCAVVGMPGEIFSEIGHAVRIGSPFTTTLVAGYSQGILGYVSTPAEYVHGGYEPAVAHRGYDHPAPFAPEAADLLITTATDLLTRLAQAT